jgi:hypothetical protein
MFRNVEAPQKEIEEIVKIEKCCFLELMIIDGASIVKK